MRRGAGGIGGVVLVRVRGGGGVIRHGPGVRRVGVRIRVGLGVLIQGVGLIMNRLGLAHRRGRFGGGHGARPGSGVAGTRAIAIRGVRLGDGQLIGGRAQRGGIRRLGGGLGGGLGRGGGLERRVICGDGRLIRVDVAARIVCRRGHVESELGRVVGFQIRVLGLNEPASGSSATIIAHLQNHLRLGRRHAIDIERLRLGHLQRPIRRLARRLARAGQRHVRHVERRVRRGVVFGLRGVGGARGLDIRQIGLGISIGGRFIVRVRLLVGRFIGGSDRLPVGRVRRRHIANPSGVRLGILRREQIRRVGRHTGRRGGGLSARLGRIDLISALGRPQRHELRPVRLAHRVFIRRQVAADRLRVVHLGLAISDFVGRLVAGLGIGQRAGESGLGPGKHIARGDGGAGGGIERAGRPGRQRHIGVAQRLGPRDHRLFDAGRERQIRGVERLVLGEARLVHGRDVGGVGIGQIRSEQHLGIGDDIGHRRGVHDPALRRLGPGSRVVVRGRGLGHRHAVRRLGLDPRERTIRVGRGARLGGRLVGVGQRLGLGLLGAGHRLGELRFRRVVGHGLRLDGQSLGIALGHACGIALGNILEPTRLDRLLVSRAGRHFTNILDSDAQPDFAKGHGPARPYSPGSSFREGRGQTASLYRAPRSRHHEFEPTWDRLLLRLIFGRDRNRTRFKSSYLFAVGVC